MIDEDDELHPALPLVRLIAVQHRRLKEIELNFKTSVNDTRMESSTNLRDKMTAAADVL